MSRVLNIGSLNIDYVYQVPHFLRAGETLAAYRRAVHIGGKGLNQSVALARAGLDVSHAGIIGQDGSFLKVFLEHEGVDVSRIAVATEESSGHTFIQVSSDAENAILYYPGTNTLLTREFVAKAMKGFGKGDALLIQNETSSVRNSIELALERGMRVIFNPSPIDDQAPLLPLNRLSALILNETEAEGLLRIEKRERTHEEQVALVTELSKLYPDTTILVTLGGSGVAFRMPGYETDFVPAFKVMAADTTGAGDTFTGFAVRGLLAAWEKNNVAAAHATLKDGVKFACMAAAISVTRHGSAESIPTYQEVYSSLTEMD